MLIDLQDNISNPLDHVEQILSDNNWSYSRMADNELMVQVTGRACTYRLFFVWQENMNALKFNCQYDLSVSRNNIANASLALMEMNASMWIGHFEIERDTRIPSFRHTSLLKGCGEQNGFESIHDLVDIALAECERFWHVFAIMAQEKNANTESLSLALMETQGES
jgi:hypothetical protein